MNKDTKIMLMAFAILLVGLISFSFGDLTDNTVAVCKKENNWICTKFYEGVEPANSHLTQRGKCVQNCFKEDNHFALFECHEGCYFAEQIMYPNQVKLGYSSNLYNECSGRCWEAYINKK